MERVLHVGETAPVGAVNDEDGEREAVAQYELGYAGNGHGHATEEVVVAGEADE